MNRIRSVIYLLAGGLVYLTVGCKSSEQVKPVSALTTIDTVLIPKIVKDYAWFNVGTYWVYEDSVTGVLDSLSVYNSVNKFQAYTLNYHGSTTVLFEELGVNFNSALDNSQYRFSVRGCVCLPQNHDFEVEYIKYPPNLGLTYSYLMTYPLNLNQGNAAMRTGLYILLDILTDYEIAGTNYNEVLVYSNSRDETMDYDKTITWVAKGYGIIRKQSLTKNKAYWLKRANIIK